MFFFEEVNGAQRWIDLKFFNLQPAEFAKIVVIVALAAHLAPPLARDELATPRVLTWPRMMQAILIAAIPGALIFIEPDLGTTLVFGFVLIVMLFVAGANWRQMATLFTAIGTAVFVVWNWKETFLQDHQLDRLTVLWDENVDPTGIGYQLRQSEDGDRLGSDIRQRHLRARHSHRISIRSGTGERLHLHGCC